jgi:hypothetical protein
MCRIGFASLPLPVLVSWLSLYPTTPAGSRRYASSRSRLTVPATSHISTRTGGPSLSKPLLLHRNGEPMACGPHPHFCLTFIWRPGSVRRNRCNCVRFCRGNAGRGNGLAASALDVLPPDLTTLARRHGGKFPDAMFQAPCEMAGRWTPKGPPRCRLGAAVPGARFFFQSETNQRIATLAAHLKSLQTK